MQLFCRVSVADLFVIVLICITSKWSLVNASGNETDRIALLHLKDGLSTNKGVSDGVLSSWNDSVHYCSWHGITCSIRHPQRVASVVLPGQQLSGVLSPYIGNLSFLRVVNLQNNSLHGVIPQEISNLFRLQQLSLANNVLEGEIPANLSSWSKMKVIDLSRNKLVGRIPEELGSLTLLEDFRILTNNLSGEIPASIGNLTLLRIFRVSYNNLVGNIPDSMSKLTRLVVFFVNSNKLSGAFPEFIFNISSLTSIATADNPLKGSLPENMDLTLPNLQIFGISNNEFSGTIPSSLSNASQLGLLDLGENNFVGEVPVSFGNLKSLSWLRLNFNNLGSNSTDDLRFLTYLSNCSNLEAMAIVGNNFGGILPDSVGNLSTKFTQIYFSENQITGSIPASLANLVNLIALGMEENLFTGSIPSSFGKFEKMQALALTGNRLTGEIPSSIGNLTQLGGLYLERNNLQGRIPPSIQNCKNLYDFDVSGNNLSGNIPLELLAISSLSRRLNLSYNSFSGILPTEVGKLSSLTNMDISENNLYGEIPTTIGDCTNLAYLYLQGNSFNGSIPSSLSSLKGLQALDLSRNNLTGDVPPPLQEIPFLHYLNISFNNLVGPVPTRGVFGNASAISLVGNSDLCGGVVELHLRKCHIQKLTERKSIVIVLAIIIPTFGVVGILLIIGFLLIFRRRKTEKKSLQPTPSMDHTPNVSYKDIYHSTNQFSPDNIVGSGGFGTVYKGFLNKEYGLVAVKVLKLEQKGASKSFIAECNVLKNIRHRNLVKLLTFCSSMDYKGNEFKALVFKFLVNGSLESWLHPDNGSISRDFDIIQRLNIAIDVAAALHYLHDLYDVPIIHSDLKPSNILLDDDMVAHVSDFGLARFLTVKSDRTQSSTSTATELGTLGYAAPEYGMGSTASKEGDIYSYGVLLLEMFTGRRPTDGTFEQGFDLHRFVSTALPKRVLQIVDPVLLPSTTEPENRELRVGTSYNDQAEIVGAKCGKSDETKGDLEKCLLSILEIGLNCSRASPKARMRMVDVTRDLNVIKSELFG